MNNKNKIGALAVKCEEQKEKILELESELRRAKHNQEINDVTKNRLSMAIKYLEGQVEILREKAERDTEAKRRRTEGAGCEYCNTTLYIRTERTLLPVMAPLTYADALKHELINIMGKDYVSTEKRYCHACGRELKGD